MSRQLPARPSLDHLKKQAKELLATLVLENPDAQLADALHALAREYGFASWPKLKTHVDAQPRPAENPFVGRWAANVAKSKQHPANPFRSATIEFAVDDDLVTMTHVMVSESGQEEQGTQTFRADGREHPSPQGKYSLMARWRGSHTLETEAKHDGQVVGRGTYKISDDDDTLTVTAPEQMIVLERQST